MLFFTSLKSFLKTQPTCLPSVRLKKKYFYCVHKTSKTKFQAHSLLLSMQFVCPNVLKSSFCFGLQSGQFIPHRPPSAYSTTAQRLPHRKILTSISNCRQTVNKFVITPQVATFVRVFVDTNWPLMENLAQVK